MKSQNTFLSYDEAIRQMDTMLHLPGNFGYIKRELTVCGMSATVYLAEGLHDGEAAARVIAACMEATAPPPPADEFSQAHLPDDTGSNHLRLDVRCQVLAGLWTLRLACQPGQAGRGAPRVKIRFFRGMLLRRNEVDYF